MKDFSGIEFASEHNGTDVFRLIELAYEQGRKDGHSEQLSTNLAEVGTDCISRQQAIDAVRMVIGDNRSISVCDAIKQLPPIQPEIVRCKECKHWIPYDWMFSEVWQSKNIADYPEDEIGCDCCDMAMKANDFCSRVERRTE